MYDAYEAVRLKKELGMVKKYHTRSEQAAGIRRVIEANEGKPIKLEDFMLELGYSTPTSASPPVSRLIKEGRIVRTRQGKGSVYRWIEDTGDKQEVLEKGGVYQINVTPEYYHKDRLRDAAMEWMLEEGHAEVHGVLAFIKWMEERDADSTDTN